MRVISGRGPCVEPAAPANLEFALGQAFEEICGFMMSTIVRAPAQMGELTRYGARLTAQLKGELRRYVTLLKRVPTTTAWQG